MRIKFLGTSAAEGIPALFCECETCRMARKLGGKNIRTRAQALVDGKILIDFGPDTNHHALQNGIELASIRHCLVTHAHPDHLYLDDIEKRHSTYACLEHENASLVFHGSKLVFHRIGNLIKRSRLRSSKRVFAREAVRYVPFRFDGYVVTALDALHSPNVDPIIYMIEKDGKALLYAHDTGLFPDSVWEHFERVKPHFDLVSLDCTGGSKPIYYDAHMNADRCKTIKDRLIAEGYADEKTVFCLNHFSHFGIDCDFDSFCKLPNIREFTVSYDGLEIEF